MKKMLIKFALSVLRWCGNKKLRMPETPRQVFERRKGYLQELVDVGYRVEEKTPYQIRINGRLDVYPTNARWHDIKTGQRGGFEHRNLATFIRKYFKEI